jgi:membrane protease YdiL (CAAX protease family)
MLEIEPLLSDNALHYNIRRIRIVERVMFKKIFDRIFHREQLSIKHVLSLYCFVFAFWSLYRYFPENVFPLWVEELILKPLIWLTPTFWLVLKVEKEQLSSLGITKKNLFPALYWGIGLGIVFAAEGLITNIVKYRGLQLPELNYSSFELVGMVFLSLATAFSEETVFRGYIFTRLWRLGKNEWLANLISSFLFALIHLPIGLFVLSYTPTVMLAYLFFVFIFGFGSAFVFARSENLVSSILLHSFWSWPIILFR